MADVYDFYKPNLSSEYPEVDGPLTVSTYIQAFDQSYQRYCEKLRKAHGHKLANGASAVNGNSKRTSSAIASTPIMQTFDFFLLHNPYNKMVQKAHARLVRRLSMCPYCQLTYLSQHSYSTTSERTHKTPHSHTSPTPITSSAPHTPPP